MGNIKKFEDFLDKMQGLLDNAKKQGHIIVRVEDIENTFPELKESEDEKIKEDLIQWISDFPDMIWRGHYREDVITWLKRQDKSALEAIKKEKVDNANKVEPKDYNSIDPHFGKPADKVEPKFLEGEWVVFNYRHDSVYQVEKIENYEYTLRHFLGGSMPLSFSHEDMIREWTINDAKEGDVLAFYCEYKGNKMVQVGIIEKYVGKHGGCSNTFKIYVGVDWENNLKIGEYMGCPDIRPATKEQRDTFERAMADAGYAFDFGKKELKELGQSEVTKMSDQEEIAEIPFGAKDGELQEATYYIPKGFHAEIDDDKVVIKKDEKPTAWSEEDEQIILSIEQAMNCASLLNLVPEKMNKIRTWLKSLKNRVGCEANCTTTQKWSESDKEEFQIAIDTLVEAGQHDSAHWLKTLKQRIGGQSYER